MLCPQKLIMHCIVAHCLMIAPNSSLHDLHTFALDNEHWLDSSLVFNRNEDSFNHAMSRITHYQLKNIE